MSKRAGIMALFTISVATLVAVQLSRSSTGSAQSVPSVATVRVAMFGGEAPPHFVVAQKRGLFEQLGVRVVVEPRWTSEELREGLAEGRFDIVHSLADNAVAVAEDLKVPTVILTGSGGGGRSGGVHLVSQPHIRTIAQLRGTTILVDSPDTGHALALRKILRRQGLEAGRDYTMRPQGQTQKRFEAMRADKAFAATMMPFNEEARTLGFNSLGDAAAIVGPYQASAIYARKDWVTANPTAAVGYLAGHVHVGRWIRDPANKPAILETLGAASGADAARLYERLLESVPDREPAFDLDAFRNSLALRADIEGTWGGTPPAPERYYDPSYAVTALALVPAPSAGREQRVSPNAEVAGLQAKFVDVDGVRTRYYEYGQGEPMVLVHGGGRGTTSSANNWSPVIPLLAKRFHVFAVDKSAAGMTGNPKDDRDLSPRGEVVHMYRFLQTMRLNGVHLVGHSSGGALSFYLAIEHPEMIKTLTIVAHGPGMPPAGETSARHDVREQEICKAPQTTYEGRKCRLELLGHTPATFDEAFLQADAWMADQPKSREAREKYAKQPAQPGNPYREAAWAQARNGRLQMPILLYGGKQDTLSWENRDPHAMLRGELQFFDIVGAKNPRVKMIIVNEAGHFPYREHPEQFTADLTDFIGFWSARPGVPSTRSTPPRAR